MGSTVEFYSTLAHAMVSLWPGNLGSDFSSTSVKVQYSMTQLKRGWHRVSRDFFVNSVRGIVFFVTKKLPTLEFTVEDMLNGKELESIFCYSSNNNGGREAGGQEEGKN